MQTTPAVPILTYHSLDDSGSVISLAPAVFRRQVRSLRDRGFRGIALGDLLDSWEGTRELPERPVVLTFDDGFRNVAEHAAGLLDELGFRATLFVVAGHCGGTNDWPTQPPRIPRLPLCSWSELRELAEGPFEVGGHGMTHAPLAGLSEDAERREIVASKNMLEDRLGRAVDLFAYPYGVAGASAREIVREHYRGACSAEMAAARAGDERDWLGRIDVYYLRRPLAFDLFGTAAGRAYLALRAFGRSCRALWPSGLRPGMRG